MVHRQSLNRTACRPKGPVSQYTAVRNERFPNLETLPVRALGLLLRSASPAGRLSL